MRNVALERGQVEFWYRPDYDATDQSELRMLFAIGPLYDAPNLHLSHREWLSLSVTAPDGTVAGVTSAWGAALWRAGEWVKIEAAWDQTNPTDSLWISVNDVRVDGGGSGRRRPC